ncbi:MAG TPA: CPBP family intramembrane glutamic endopeptidase [Chloroflexota bacterium]|nr:CPBP family intramembrane glutamic endopeptidase [Chloroflexota bacterium]
MDARLTTTERPLHSDRRRQVILVVLCLVAGIAPLAARWIPDEVTRISYGLVVTAVLLALTGLARREPQLRQYAGLTFAFFVLALVQVLNNAIPGYVGKNLLHDPPIVGNPLATTVAGTVVIQLLETAIAIVPIVLLTRLLGTGLGSIYARVGKSGGWLTVALIFFAVFYLFLATLPLRPDSPAHQLLPSSGAVTFARFLALTPALLIVAISNAFQEEFLFRGLFLQKYAALFGIGTANVVQALVFAVAHVGITYTPTASLFIVAVVFPLGLVAGYLMRVTNGILTPAIFHAGLDLAIYLAFLSYAS